MENLHYVMLSSDRCNIRTSNRQLVDSKLTTLSLLVDAGGDMHATDQHGQTILYQSFSLNAEWPYIGAFALAALELGVPPGSPNHQGRTILHVVSVMNDKFRMDTVLDPKLGIDVNVPDHERVTPLHLAATVSEKNSLRLIHAGAAIQSTTREGKAPLHSAARAGQSNIVDFLIDLYQQQSLSVDFPDMAGRTPLHDAVESGRPESVKQLLDAGAKPSVCDQHGRSPLHAAAVFRNGCQSQNMNLTIQSENDTCDIHEVIRLLIDAGADVILRCKTDSVSCWGRSCAVESRRDGAQTPTLRPHRIALGMRLL